jgi:hypothetical protein
MKEKAKLDKANAPPTPQWCARLSDTVSKRMVVVNFSESKRVKQPKDRDADIPIVVLPPTDEVDGMGVPILLYEVGSIFGSVGIL